MPLALGFSLALSLAITGSTAPPAGGLAAVIAAVPTQTVQQYIENYFTDVPVMIDIARCESHFRQFNTVGGVYRGKTNRYDIGAMQINELYHKEKATDMGLNLSNLEDNVAYARYLYETEGTKPWNSSKVCWSPANANSDTAKVAVVK